MLKLRGYFMTLGMLGVAMMTMALTDSWERFPDLFYRPGPDAHFSQRTAVRTAALAGQDVLILDRGGRLWSIDERAERAREEPLSQYVLGLCVQNAIPTVLTATSPSATQWTVRRRVLNEWREGRTVQSEGDGFVGLLCEEQSLLILSARRMIRLGDDGATESRRLSARVPVIDVSTVLDRGDEILVGNGAGEFGGGVHRITRRTGAVTTIEQTQRLEPCDGLLNTECDPVASITPIPWKSDCVAILVGPSMLDRSAVLESCGGALTRLSPTPCKPTGHGPDGRFCVSTGMAVVEDRLVLTGTHEPVWLDRDGGAETRPLPPFRKIGPFDLLFQPTRVLIDRSPRPDYRNPTPGRDDLDLIVVERTPAVAAQVHQARRPAT